MRNYFNDSLRSLFGRVLLGTRGFVAQSFAAAQPSKKSCTFQSRAAGKPIFALVAVLTLIVGLSAPTPAHAQMFDGPGGSGSGWIDMLRGNYAGGWGNGGLGDIWKCLINPAGCGVNDAPIADAGASYSYVNALRMALGVYSNGLLIVASIILLYHLLVMTSETAHSGVVGGKRTNQIWAPIRLVMAIGLLVPISAGTGLNSGQYISLQIIEWGSNLGTYVWHTFLTYAGTGAGSNPTPHMPDTGSIAREAAKIGACKALINNYNEKNKVDQRFNITLRTNGSAYMWGDEKNQALCGSMIVFAGGAGAMAGVAEIMMLVDQMDQYAKYFQEGNKEANQNPPAPPAMTLSFALGTLESVDGSWNNGAYAGTGWVGAGAYFLTLAAGGSNRVSGTDTLPIIMGPQAERIRPQQPTQNAFFRMAEWIVGKYKSNLTGGGADPDMIGNTVAGRKFVDLMLLFIDQLGVTSGLWEPGGAAFVINLGNSPLAELVDLGHRMIRTALDFIGAAVELGVNEPQHAAYSALKDSSKDNKAFGPISGTMFAYMAVPLLAAFATALMTTGIQLGIFLPLLPFVKFVMSVLTWLISVIETMVCVPLMSLALLTPYGEGFGGQKAEPGFYLVLHTFLRPAMTIFGLVASILLFNIAAHLVTTFYYAITGNAETFSGGMYVVTKIGFGMMYASILYVALNGCLKVMDTFGRNATRWMGGQSHEEAMGDGQQAVQMAMTGMGGFTQGLSSMAQYSLSAGQTAAAQMGGGHKSVAPGSDPLEQQRRQNLIDQQNNQFGAAAGNAVNPQGSNPQGSTPQGNNTLAQPSQSNSRQIGTSTQSPRRQ